jgi:nucleotide-binding universal stress UspA family protein
MFLNVLVGIDGSSSSERAVEHAIELARAGNAKLTLMAVAPPVSSYVTLARTIPETMRADLDKWARSILDEAFRAVPDDVIAHAIQSSGHAGPELMKELKRGGYDLIVFGSRGITGTRTGTSRCDLGAPSLLLLSRLAQAGSAEGNVQEPSSISGLGR